MAFVDKWPSKMQGNGFSEVGRGRAGSSFRSGTENLEFFLGRLPLPVSTSHGKLLVGGGSNVPCLFGVY